MNAPVEHCATCPFYDEDRSHCRVPEYLEMRVERTFGVQDRCREDDWPKRIEDPSTIPSWCPLRLAPVVVHLEVK